MCFFLLDQRKTCNHQPRDLRHSQESLGGLKYFDNGLGPARHLPYYANRPRSLMLALGPCLLTQLAIFFRMFPAL
jgi:hypothetical protein